MAFVIKLLATGVISGAGTNALYTVQSPAVGAIVSNIRFMYTTTGSAVLNLYFKPSGGSQVRIWDRDKWITGGEIYVFKPELTMGPSDAIELTTTTGSIEYVVSGMEKV